MGRGENRKKPVLGYPSRTAAAVALQAQGLRPQQIAERIGAASGDRLTVKAVYSLLANARLATGPGTLVVVAPGPVYGALAAAGRARGLQARGLATHILELVAAEGMIDAVLDDGVVTPAAPEGRQ
jgi:hypothetical protein